MARYQMENLSVVIATRLWIVPGFARCVNSMNFKANDMISTPEIATSCQTGYSLYLGFLLAVDLKQDPRR